MTDNPLTGVVLVPMSTGMAHWPGNVHGWTLCGEQMEPPWMAGPISIVMRDVKGECQSCIYLRGPFIKPPGNAA